jgi:hypothetical protein
MDNQVAEPVELALTGDTPMKRSVLYAALIAALPAPTAFAQDTKAAPAKPAMGMDLDKHAVHMQGKMKEMQGQMDKIRETTDPKERQKLMQEHMQAMQANMDTMQMMMDQMKQQQMPAK